MDVATLKNRHDELLKANYLWDERYSELEREFDEYRKGAAEAQRKASDYIFSLKENVALLQKEINDFQTQHRRVLAAEQQMVPIWDKLEQELRDSRHESRRAQAKLESVQLRCRELEIENRQLQEENRRLRHHGTGSGGGGDGQRVGRLSVTSGLLQLQLLIVEPSDQDKPQFAVPAPTLPEELPELTTQGLVNFMPAIAPKWFRVAHALGVGEKAASLEGLEKTPEDKCLQILECWIERDIDCTWKKLIDVLCQQGLGAVAQKICQSLQ